MAFSLPQVQPGVPGHGGLLTISGTARRPQARWPSHYLRYRQVAPGTVAFSLPQVQPGGPGHSSLLALPQVQQGGPEHGGLLTTSGTARWPRARWPFHYLRYSQMAPGTVAFSLPKVQPGGPGHCGLLITSGTMDSTTSGNRNYLSFALHQIGTFLGTFLNMAALTQDWFS